MFVMLTQLHVRSCQGKFTQIHTNCRALFISKVCHHLKALNGQSDICICRSAFTVIWPLQKSGHSTALLCEAEQSCCQDGRSTWDQTPQPSSGNNAYFCYVNLVKSHSDVMENVYKPLIVNNQVSIALCNL